MVYFITSGDFVKIGISDNPRSRLAQMQTGSPTTLDIALTMPGGRFEEKCLHDQFRALHIRGEWFRFERQIRDFIAEQLYPQPSGDDLALCNSENIDDWTIFTGEPG